MTSITTDSHTPRLLFNIWFKMTSKFWVNPNEALDEINALVFASVVKIALPYEVLSILIYAFNNK